ncbi:Uncharacterised protein [Suttonella ornithocola]|uniref:Uncharacterized protein n=2 Tax=Suttonella ornithocola TaxID=279832 RepID=A0A380MS13_9GAMM|nr:Uncharacterised protein [Suttonella ornithocola]
MNTYIDCYNDADERAISSIHRYESWVKDKQKSPTGKEKNIYGLYSLNGVEACKENMPQAIAAEPKNEALDTAAQKYLDALLALDEKVQEADKYYSRENYKDDNFAKGKEIHPGLVKAMDDFEVASENLSGELDNINDKSQRELLEKLKAEDPKSTEYATLLMVVTAKDLTNSMTNDEFDIDNATKEISTFEDANDILLNYLKEHPNEEVDFIRVNQAAENFIVAAKERMRRVRDKTPYSKGEQTQLNPQSGWMVSGSPYKLLRAFNQLIDAFNG